MMSSYHRTIYDAIKKSDEYEGEGQMCRLASIPHHRLTKWLILFTGATKLKHGNGKILHRLPTRAEQMNQLGFDSEFNSSEGTSLHVISPLFYTLCSRLLEIRMTLFVRGSYLQTLFQ